MDKALFSCDDSDMDICKERNSPDLEDVNDIVLLGEEPGSLKLFLDHPNFSVYMFRMFFSSDFQILR